MISILLPKIIAGLLVLPNVFLFFRATRRNVLKLYHYCALGLSGYGFVAQWVSGMLWDGVEILWDLCLLGCIVGAGMETARLYCQSKKDLQALQRHIEQTAKGDAA